MPIDAANVGAVMAVAGRESFLHPILTSAHEIEIPRSHVDVFSPASEGCYSQRYDVGANSHDLGSGCHIMQTGNPRHTSLEPSRGLLEREKKRINKTVLAACRGQALKVA